MKRMHLAGLLAAALAAGVYVVGCSGTGSSGGGVTCSADTDCTGTNEVCNTQLGVCMTKCSQGSDCPSTMKNCVAVAGVTGTNVCTCSTDALCGGGSVVCSTTDQICETKCSDDSACSGFKDSRKCDTSTGQCVPSSGGTCDPNVANSCPQGQTCDPTTHQCVSASTCSSTSQCTYGDFCNTSTTSCSPVAVGTCSAASYAPTWDKTDQAPEITGVTVTGSSTSDASNECSGGGPKVEFSISFYAPNGLHTDSFSQADFVSKHIRYIDPNGNIKNPAYAKNLPAAGATEGEFIAGICGTSTLTNGAIFLQDENSHPGNAVCVSTQ